MYVSGYLSERNILRKNSVTIGHTFYDQYNFSTNLSLCEIIAHIWKKVSELLVPLSRKCIACKNNVSVVTDMNVHLWLQSATDTAYSTFRHSHRAGTTKTFSSYDCHPCLNWVKASRLSFILRTLTQFLLWIIYCGRSESSKEWTSACHAKRTDCKLGVLTASIDNTWNKLPR
jgi:hypothetical protein